MTRVAITVGEPGGVGPEVALKAVSNMRASGLEAVLVGPADVFRQASVMTGLSPGARLIDTGECEFQRNRPTAGGGLAAFNAIKRAVEMALDGEVDAIVTAPIAKEALRMAGLPWPGHTEMLAELTSATDYGMMLVGGGLRVVLVTIHCALRDVPALITKDSVLRTVRLAGRAAEMLSIPSPRIAVAALNPHAGESGMFGLEERDIIGPAIEQARALGMDATGPHPPDTVFYRSRRGEFDMVVCMYHDQGLIPLKLVGFDTGVNVTVGLPIIRTSPDHGTAYDIAWRNEADPASMQEAIGLAMSMSRGKSGRK